MNGQGEYPDFVAKEQNKEPEVIIERIQPKPAVWSVLVWTMYLFQIAIAIPAIYYGWTMPDSYDWTSHWSIIGNILGSLFAVSWIEKNVINKDDGDGRY